MKTTRLLLGRMKKYIQTRQYEGSLKMEKRGMAWEKVGVIKERSDRF